MYKIDTPAIAYPTIDIAQTMISPTIGNKTEAHFIIQFDMAQSPFFLIKIYL